MYCNRARARARGPLGGSMYTVIGPGLGLGARCPLKGSMYTVIGPGLGLGAL